MSKDKTLVILTPAFPKNESETYWIPFLQLLIKAIKRNFPGLNIIVLSFAYPRGESTYSWNGFRVTSFNGAAKRKLKRIFFWRKIWKTLNNIRRHHNIIGLLSIWCGECAFIGKYFGKRYSIKHLSWICGQDALKSNKWVRFIRPKPDQLAAMSFFLVNEFNKNHHIKPQYIIPNAIDPQLFLRHSDLKRDIDVLGAGSLVPLKQYDLFVRAVASTRDAIPDLRAFHCGGGGDKEKIETLIKQLRLAGNLQLLGEKTHEEVLGLMQKTKVFLHTSRFEGFGGVCLEALYAGAHVISFTYPLEHPVGHWHVVSNIDEMAAKAIDILRDPNTEYSPVLVYSMDDSAKGVMNLFDNESV